MTSSTDTRVFLVTANIASCFDNPKEMLNPWLDEFFKVVTERQPQFIALHCQEVGGKNYEASMENVEEFLRNILNRAATLHFTRTRVFIDEEFSCAHNFTALGNLYFIRHDVQDVQIWNFKEGAFCDVQGKEEFVGNIEDVPIKEKSKFPQEFFPECKWSRKGFLRTRWRLNGTQMDFVNIHLFHDASNFIAMEKFPSVYTLNRKRAMEHTLDRFHNDSLENVPIFLFGDFNFRLDTGGVVQKLTANCSVPEESEVSGEKTQDFKDKTEETSVLSVSKKSFSHADHSSIFLKDNGSWLRPFDKELQEFGPRLQEFPINFPPSYPFEEGVDSSKDPQKGEHYMKTRCPSWCDRVILSQNAKELVDKGSGEVHYDLIGLNTRMGDHKPVGLCLQVPTGAGITRCCLPPRPCVNFVHDPRNRCFLMGAWCRCQSYPKCPGVGGSNQYPCSSAAWPSINNDIAPPSSTHVLRHSTDSGNKDSFPLVAGGPKGTTQLLKTLLRLNGKAQEDCSLCGAFPYKTVVDPLLKRVHSDPIKVKNYCERVKGVHLTSPHSNLVHSHSLDGGKHEDKGPHPKLRLRTASSRLISHHSSSSEEWYEEISSAEEAEDTRVLHPSSPAPSNKKFSRNEDVLPPHLSLSDDDEVPMCKPPRFLGGQNSLNNLLIGDNPNGCLDSCSGNSSLPRTVIPPFDQKLPSVRSVSNNLCSTCVPVLLPKEEEAPTKGERVPTTDKLKDEEARGSASSCSCCCVS